MVKSKQSAFQDALSLRATFIVALLLSALTPLSGVQAQEAYYGSSTTGVESTPSWPWWHSLYYRADGSTRYGRGFGNSTRHHQYRVPIEPPICGPSFGYHQTCWRQIPLVRRCVTCETLPSNREIPDLNGFSSLSPTQIPPAPEASADLASEKPDSDEAEPAPLPLKSN